MDIGPERLQADNPGSVTAGPLMTPGTHTVWVAQKLNDPLKPYTLWTGSGPFEVKAGKKYLVRIEDGSPPRVAWTEEPARLSTYRNPGSMGAVYFNNGTQTDKWYGVTVCLGGGGPGAGVKIAMHGFDFGITISNGKRLTYASDGATNTTVVKIDGQVTAFGHPNGKVVEPYAPLPNGGVRSTWIMNNVRFTQMLEPVMSQSGARDTVMVRWLIRNEDTKTHQVGLRLQLDTLIGQNDGVPFTVPGMPGLVTTTADFPKQGPIPHFVQALEVADLKNPGTVAHLSLKLGGRIEAPGRLCLTHWPGTILNWEIPMTNLTGDSAAVLYWPETNLALSEEREIGFSYGLGDVKSSEGRIGITTATNAQAGQEFPITAYVRDATAGETLTLEVPTAIQVAGATTVAVPAAAADSKDRTSLVTWKAKAMQAGNFQFTVRSSNGASQAHSISVAKSTANVPKDDGTPVQKLIQQLQDPDETTRLRAAKELGKLGAAAASAIPALQTATKDADEDVRRVAANSLRTIQATLTSGPSEQVQRLINELQSPNEFVRLKAAKELGKLGPAARDAVPALQKLASDPDEDVRVIAANSVRLIQAGAGPSEAVQKLIQQLANADEIVRMKAAKDLAKIGPSAKSAIPALQKLLQDPDEDVRRVAANAIERIQGATPPPITTTSLAGTTWSGTENLAGFGKLTFQFEPDGKAVMIDAQTKVNGKWSQSGNQVTITFSNCVYTGAIQGSVLAGNARYTTGTDATWTFSLTRSGAVAPTDVKSASATNGSDAEAFPVTREKAYPMNGAPMAFLQTQQSDLQRFIQDLQSPDELIRLKAAKELGKLGGAARDAIPALQKVLQDPDEDVRRIAANSIERIQSAGVGTMTPRQITNQELEALLRNMGFEVKTQTIDGGVSFHNIAFPRGTWNVPCAVFLSPNKQYVWVDCNLGKLRPITAESASDLLRVLEANWDVGPALFAVNKKYGTLYMQQSMENRDVTAARLRQVIDHVANETINKHTIWRNVVSDTGTVPSKDSIVGTTWQGSETLSGFGQLMFRFEVDGKVVMIDAKQTIPGKWTQTGNDVTITFGDCVYRGTIQGQTLAGSASFISGTNVGTNWTFTLTRSTGVSLGVQQRGPVALRGDKPLPELKIRHAGAFSNESLGAKPLLGYKSPRNAMLPTRR